MSIFDSNEVSAVRCINHFEKYGAFILGTVLIGGSLRVMYE